MEQICFRFLEQEQITETIVLSERAKTELVKNMALAIRNVVRPEGDRIDAEQEHKRECQNNGKPSESKSSRLHAAVHGKAGANEQRKSETSICVEG